MPSELPGFIEYRKGKDAGWHIFGRPLGLISVIFYEGVWGLSELLIGAVVYWSSNIIAAELADDPQDLLINWILRSLHPNIANAHQYGSLIIFMSITKLALAIGLWYRSYLVRNIGLAIFLLLAVYGSFQVLSRATFLRIALLMIGVIILYYFWKILPKHIRHHEIE